MKTSRRQLCRQSLRALCAVFLATRLSRSRAQAQVLAQLDVRDFGATRDGHALETAAFHRHRCLQPQRRWNRRGAAGNVRDRDGISQVWSDVAFGGWCSAPGDKNPKDYGLVDPFKDAVSIVEASR